MIYSKIQDNTVVNSLSYFFHYFSPFPYEIRYSNKQFVRNDVISCKKSVSSYIPFNENEVFLLFSPLLIIVSLVIVCSCRQMTIQGPDLT